MKRFNRKVLISVALSVMLLLCAGITVRSILAGNSSDHKETAIRIEDKASILKQLYENGENLEILSIVPYKEMITMDVMCPDSDFLDLIQNRVENLYDKGDKNGNVATLRNGIADSHKFFITKLGSNYTVDYPNYFIESIFPKPTDGSKDIYKTYREYFSKHIKVTTVAASQLTDNDIVGADMIFVFGKPDRSNTITGMYNYLHSDKSNDQLNPYNVDSRISNLYKEDQNGGFYQVTDENSGYDTFYKNSYGEYESNDISWDMALKVIRYSYTKNIEDTPEKYYERVPVIIESSSMNTNSNIWKMTLLISNCKGLNADGTRDGSYYYRDILAGLKFEDELDSTVNSSITYNQTVTYSNKIIKFNNTVQIGKTSSGISVTPSSADQNSRDEQILTAGGYIKVMTINSRNYLYMYDSNNTLVKRFEVTYSNKQLKVEYNITDGTNIRVATENNDKYTTPAGHILTPAYKNNGTYSINWGKTQSDYLLDVRNQDIKNHVYVNDSGSNGVFLMGVENFAVSGDCLLSAQARDIPAEEMKNGLSWYFRYLFGADPTDFMYSKDLNVLEIEPCQDFMYDYTNASNKDTIRNNIYEFARKLNFINYKKFDSVYNYEAYIKNTSQPQITFTCVTTAQFNGMNEDIIAEYDVIVMGSNTGLMNKSSGKTIYNDTSLNGYVYLAYGDLCKINSTLLGWLPEDYEKVDYGWGFTYISDDSSYMTTGLNGSSKVVFSKNIRKLWSNAVYNKLQTYKDNYFVVKNTANEFYYYRDNSHLYGDSLGNTRFADNDITELKLKELIDYAKSGQPVVLADNIYSCTVDRKGGIVYPTSHVYSFVDQMKDYGNVIADNEAAAKLTALIAKKNLEITSYSMKYDKDGDGVNESIVPDVTYDSTGLLRPSCVLKDIDSFTYSVTMATKPGVTYHLELIVDKNTDGRYNEEASTDDYNEVYYTKKFKATATSTTVNFDIKLPSGYNGLLSWRILVTDVDDPSTEVGRASVDGYTAVSGNTKTIKVLQIMPDSSSEVTLNLGSDATFKKLLQNATKNINYNIMIDTITASNFEKIYAAHPYDKLTDYDTNKNYLKTKEYSMVIVGFADAYGSDDISNDFGALDCLIDFMNKGNAVLFTHDTISFSNNVNYNIMNGNSGLVFNTEMKWCVDFSRLLRYKVGMDRYSISQISDLTNTSELEAANVPKNSSGKYITEIQGYNNIQIYSGAYSKNFTNKTLSNSLYTLTTTSNSSKYGIGKLLSSTKAEELNEGQITKYPYYTTDANGSLDITKTHAQYYQLDMEDKDIVVWYTLGGDKETYYGDNAKNAGLNYYIYSKGNITYSGAGHSKMTDEKELQLFVNTIVKAAVAGNFVPNVKITNAASLKNDNEYVMYPNSLDNEIEVRFIATDADLASREIVENSYSTEKDILDHIGKFNSGAVYWIDDLGAKRPLIYYSHDSSNFILNGEESSFKLYDPFEGAADVTAAYNAASDADKNMYDCYQAYITEGSVNLSVEVSDVYGETGYGNLKIVEHQLFDLD